MLIYSFFDIRLKQPLKVAAILYFFVLFILIGLPILIFSWPPNVYKLAAILGIPLGGAIFMSSPRRMFDDRTFLPWIKTQMKYNSRPQILFDWKGQPKETVYKTNSMITVSRHDDYNELYQITKKEIEEANYV